MSSWKTFVKIIAFGGAAAVATVPASALTVKNLDAEPRAITIRENDAVSKRTVAPEEKAEGLCSSPCQIETADGYIYDFDGGEYVTIEDGVLDIASAADTPAR